MTKLSKKKVRLAIPNTFGVRSLIAEKCAVTRVALHYFLNKPKNSDLLDEIELEKEFMKDVGENKLGAAMLRGEKWAVKFFLERKARDRGYGSKQEIELSGGVGIIAEDFADEWAKIQQEEKEEREKKVTKK